MTFLQRFMVHYQSDFKHITRPYVWLWIAGLVSALAFEPFGFELWVMAPSFCFLLMQSQSSHPKKAFKQGWVFGFGHYLGGLYWISISLTIDFKQFFWLFPLALGAIPGLLALLSGLSLMLANGIGVNTWTRRLAFCFFWCAFEWIRGHFWGGFPWNNLGYMWASSLPILQSASIVGVYGLGLISLLMAVFTCHKRGVWITGLLGVTLWLFGHHRLQTPPQKVPHVLLRVVQPVIQQELKWKPQQREAILEHLCNLSQTVSIRPPTHIIWPESAAVFDVVHDQATLLKMAHRLPPQAHLIFGAPRIERDTKGHMIKLWNAIFTVTQKGNLHHIYDKNYLVPFGEYIPFRDLLPNFIAKVTPGHLDYSRGQGLKTIMMPALPSFSPTICYEIIFPGRITGPKRPEWILNLTNDAWFGKSSGPYQHVAMARTRAVETGLPLVRAANNGISIVMDAHGRTLDQLALNDVGVMDVFLPKALPATFYTQYGDNLFFIFMGLMMVVLIIEKRRKQR